jgi:tRNA dimethylallyltransferase
VTASGGNSAPLIAVVGPTGSGKSALALALAEHLKTEIISVDSMQFYRGMEIGTAAPSLADRHRIPHHFVSFLDPDEEIAAGTYQKAARERVALIAEEGHPAVAAGGSGMYVSALIDGIFDGPGEDPAIRARLQAEAAREGNAHMLERVRDVDPDYAARITGANDLVRIIRALEVYELTGRPFSELHREHRERTPSLPALQFALGYEDRQDLYDRINRRVVQMIDAGWVDEVQCLLDEGFGPQLERLKALGFREIAAHLRGDKTLDEAIAAAQMHHRRYAKRQLTWFRADPRIHWIPAGPGTSTQSHLNTLQEKMNARGESGGDDSGKLHRFLDGAAPLGN